MKQHEIGLYLSSFLQPENDEEVIKAIESFDEFRQYTWVEECSLTKQKCEYYDSKDDFCYYNEESMEFWIDDLCPKDFQGSQ